MEHQTPEQEHPLENSPAISRRILIVVTAGGFSNAAPLFEIAKILHARGHILELATLEGCDHWTDGLEIFSNTYHLGPPIPADVEEENYLRMSQWRLGFTSSVKPIFETKKFLDSSWPDVYRSLSRIMRDGDSRPDMIVSDYLVDAVRDMAVEYNVPIAMHWPQMPINMLPSSYIPGIPGMQVEVLTSEHATMVQRIRNHLLPLRLAPQALEYRRWTRRMRRAEGVKTTLEHTSKPDYLLLVNSFFGLETPKDIPPNVALVGPILPDRYPPLSDDLAKFVESRRSVLYISLGTHALLDDDKLRRILHGAMNALHAGVVEGVIWSIRSMAKKQFLLDAAVLGSKLTVQDLFEGKDPNLKFVSFAPQRALLQHPHVRVFITHAGTSSVNEACFHGIPTVSIGVYFDQPQNALRLRDAGTSIPLDQNAFTESDINAAVEEITTDRTGVIGLNCSRVQRIARIASRKKHLAADLIEEVLADHEGRHQSGRQLHPPHLQTADMRMPWWKVMNLDLYLCIGFVVLSAVGFLGLSLRGVGGEVEL